MKNLTKSIVIIAFACSSIGVANAASEFVAADKTTGTEICVVAAEGNRLRLLKTIKDAGLSKRYVAEEMRCNHLNFIDFVEQYGQDVVKINNFITNGKYSTEQQIAKVAAR